MMREQLPLFDLDAGRQARDAGADVAGINSALAGHWRSDAKAAMAFLIEQGDTFSSDDLVALIGEPPVPNMLGALFLSASRSGTIQAVGLTQGKRPSAHAHMQRTWRGSP